MMIMAWTSPGTAARKGIAYMPSRYELNNGSVRVCVQAAQHSLCAGGADSQGLPGGHLLRAL